jgi:hypothetical protein
MDERREVHKFHHRRNPDQFRLNLTRPAPAAEESEGRPDAFPGGIDAIVHHRPDLRLERSELAVKEPVELCHVPGE